MTQFDSYNPDNIVLDCVIYNLQSQTKLLEKVFPIMPTFLKVCNKTISKTTPLRKENPFPQFNVASHRRPRIRLSFEYTTTLLSGEGGEGRTGTATMFRKMLSKYTIFSTVLSKIVGQNSSMYVNQLFATFSFYYIEKDVKSDELRFLGNFPPTPSLSQR